MGSQSAPRGRAHPRHGRWRAPEAILAVITTIVVAFVVASIPIAIVGTTGPDDDPKALGSALSILVQNAVFVVVPIAVLASVAGRPRPEDLGFRIPERRVRTALIALGLGVLFVVLSYLLGRLIGADNGENDQADKLGASGSLAAGIAIGLLTVTVTPIGEETLLRGVLYPGLRRTFGRIVTPVWAIVLAALVDGLLFGALHAAGAKAVYLPLLALFGVVLCLALQFTGSIWTGILLHATNNAISITALLNWPVWRGVALWLVAVAFHLSIMAVLRRRAPDVTPPPGAPAPAVGPLAG